jgi:small subunit ribosomal protein S1
VPNSMVPGLSRGLPKYEMQTAKSKMIGNTLPLQVIEVDQNQKRLVFSGSAAEKAMRKQRLQELQAGEKVTGTVANVVKFGAFVDLGGIDGLIHISKLSWENVKHPSDVIQPGDEVEVLVRDVDAERERISLDRRALTPVRGMILPRNMLRVMFSKVRSIPWSSMALSSNSQMKSPGCCTSASCSRAFPANRRKS